MMDKTNEVTKFISCMNDEQTNNFYDSLKFKTIKAEQLKQLQGAMIEGVGPVFLSLENNTLGGLLFYIKGRNGQRQVIEVYASEGMGYNGGMEILSANYEIEQKRNGGNV